MTDILSNMDRDFGDQTLGLPGAAGGGTAANNSGNEVYEPRRSARVSANTSGDGDIWQEKLVVCEAAGNKLVIRSYFSSLNSGKRNWDEPPTGASHVEAASAEDRQKAEEELKNLQFAMDINNNNNDDDGDDGKQDKKNKSSKKGKGFFSAFRKKNKDKTGGSGGGMFGKKKKENKKGPLVTDADADLQRAISLSMGITPGNDQSTSGNRINGSNSWEADDEALEMAKAISMSEAEASKGGGNHNLAEDELLQRAIEASRREVTGVAAMPAKGNDPFGLMDSESFHQQPHQSTQKNYVEGDSEFMNQKMPAKANESSKSDDHVNDDFWNQKMPAQSAKKPPPAASAATSSSYAMFDPYANNDTNGRSAPAASATAGNLKKPPPNSGGADGNSDTDSHGLLKMEDSNGTKRSSGMGLGRRFNKKHVEDQAGIV